MVDWMVVSATWRTLHFIFFVIDASCFVFEAFLVVFLFSEFVKPASPINTSYFHLLTIGYLLDFLANICWGIGQFTPLEEISLITEIYSIEQWHNMFLVGITDVLIALNRCSAIVVPQYYNRIWNPKNVIILFIVVLILPFIFDMTSLFDIDCLLHMYAKERCGPFIKAFYLKAIIINVTFGLIASLLAVIGIKRLKPVETSNLIMKKSLERRFLDQTLIGAILIVLYYSAYVYFLIEDATDETYVIVDTFVTIFYIIQHFVPMFMLFFIYPEFLRKFCKFYCLRYLGRKLQPQSTLFSKVTPAGARFSVHNTTNHLVM